MKKATVPRLGSRVLFLEQFRQHMFSARHSRLSFPFNGLVPATGYSLAHLVGLAGTKCSPGITFESSIFVLVLPKRVAHGRLWYCIREKVSAQRGADNRLNSRFIKIRTNHTGTNDPAVEHFRFLKETS